MTSCPESRSSDSTTAVASSRTHRVVDLKMKSFDYSKIKEDINGLGKDGWARSAILAPSFGSGQAIEVAVILKRSAV